VQALCQKEDINLFLWSTFWSTFFKNSENVNAENAHFKRFSKAEESRKRVLIVSRRLLFSLKICLNSGFLFVWSIFGQLTLLCVYLFKHFIVCFLQKMGICFDNRCVSDPNDERLGGHAVVIIG